MFIFIFLMIFLTAQADVMNLNEFMPTRMEDASVTDLNKLDVQGSLHYDDNWESTLLRTNLRYGVVKRVQLEVANDTISGPRGTEQSGGRTQAGFQWNFNDQDDWVPSIAIVPQLAFPTGKGDKGIDPSVKMNLTYTLVGTLHEPVGQFHFNYRWEHNSIKQKEENKIGKQLIFGYSHKISSNSSLLADFIHERDKYFTLTSNELELGWMKEWFKEFYLGLGVALELKEGYFSSTLAIQKTF